MSNRSLATTAHYAWACLAWLLVSVVFPPAAIGFLLVPYFVRRRRKRREVATTARRMRSMDNYLRRL